MHPTEMIDRDSLRADIPEFRPGDTVKVHVRVVEGNRERVQVFQGAVMRRQGGGVQETFTVRKVSFGVGVERTFPVHSPTIAKIEVTTLGDVRRAKLYYLRGRHGKAAKIKERRVPRGKAAAAVPELVEDETKRWSTTRGWSTSMVRSSGVSRRRPTPSPAPIPTQRLRRPPASRAGVW